MCAEQSRKDVLQKNDAAKVVAVNKETISLFGSINSGGLEETTSLRFIQRHDTSIRCLL